jgi:hypothetical protein
MKKTLLIGSLLLAVFLSSVVLAADRVVVIPDSYTRSGNYFVCEFQ